MDFILFIPFSSLSLSHYSVSNSLYKTLYFVVLFLRVLYQCYVCSFPREINLYSSVTRSVALE